MADRAVSAVSRRVWGQLAANPRAALERGLSPADLQAALMEVSRSRSAVRYTVFGFAPPRSAASFPASPPSGWPRSRA